MATDWAKILNPEQLAAVTAGEGPTLVLAAAGTGKTRTLTHRVAWLLEQGESPDGILLLTFTNRAAREMMERAQALAGPAIATLWSLGGTDLVLPAMSSSLLYVTWLSLIATVTPKFPRFTSSPANDPISVERNLS